MRINYGLVGLIIHLVMAGPDVYAQCPSIREEYWQLRRDTHMPLNQRIDQATDIQRQWLSCRQPVDSTFIGLLLYTGDRFREAEQYGAATRPYRQAIRYITTDPSLRSSLAQAYYLLGSAHMYDNQANRAETCFRSVIDRAKTQSADRSWGVLARVSLAYLHWSQGDYEQAIREIEAGESWALSLRNDALMAQLLCEKASALYRLGHYDEAVAEAQETIRLATKAHETDLGRYYLLLGDIENRRSKIKSAIDAYQTALTHCRLTRDLTLQAIVLTNFSNLYYRQQNYSQSIWYAQQALPSQKDPFSRALLFDLIAACYWKTAQFARAIAGYQRGLAAMPFGFRATNPGLNPAANVMRLVARKSVLLTLVQDKADTWLDYAKASRNNPQRLRHALTTYRVADQMIDYMRWDHTGQQSKLFWRNKTRGMYERAIETCFLLNDAEQAFRFFEKSRAVMLADKINELGARQQLSKAQSDEETELRQAVSVAQSELAKLIPSHNRYESVRQTLDAKQRRFEEFVKQLEIDNPAYFGYKYDTTITKLADLQRYLKPRAATFVSYFVGDSAVYVLTVASNRASLQRLPQLVPSFRRSVQTLMARLVKSDALTTQADLSQYLQSANDVYQQALAPLGLPAGCVIVSPDRFFVPFEALSSSANQAEYLVNTYAFDYAYSARLLLRKNEQSAPVLSFRNDGFLGFAPVTFAPRLGQVTLPGSDKALEAIGERFRNAKLFTHQAATRRAFEQQAAHARVIQLFTHAVADSTEREPLLYFADDTLRLSDLANGEPLRAQLAVLGACQTGVGADQVGEGVFSLARGFASLGVPSIVSTLWSVQDQATYQLTELFHQYMDEGLPKDIALQRAKQDWLRTHSGVDQLPNVWAGLILIGDPQPLRQPSRWPWVVAAVLLGAGGAGLWWRQRRAIKPAASSRLPV